jgi:hypothetical protein
MRTTQALHRGGSLDRTFLPDLTQERSLILTVVRSLNDSVFQGRASSIISVDLYPSHELLEP